MVDVVVNASGIEDARPGSAVGSVPLVEIPATAAYLDELRATGGPVLIGVDLYHPAEGGQVRNLTSGLREGGRRYLRADFPDHLLVGGPRRIQVRTYLTLSSGLATTSLGLVAHMPWLRGVIARSPHLGSSDWHVIAVNRRTRQRLSASGTGQSYATGVLTALMAEGVATSRPSGPVTADAVITLEDALGGLDL